MLRYTLFILLMLGVSSSARANNWAEGMFEELTFDFGSVPRGQVVMHPFRLVNNTKNTIHIASVRASCYCTKAETLQYTLAPGQETAIIAKMDTRLFSGVRAITVFVLFDSPRIEEVRLGVQSNSRTELLFAPETLDFKKIKKGTAPTAQMTVTFYGQPQVQVTEAKCESNFIQPKLQELRRDGSETVYQLSTMIRADIPEGKWYTDIWLTTNNAATPKLRVPLTVEVESTPPAPTPPPAPPTSKTGVTNIVLEPVKQGKESDRKVNLRGTQPFRITSIQGADQELIVRPVSNDSRTVHELTLTFRPSQTGQVNRLIRVQTDMSTNKDVEFNIQTQIVP